MVKPYPIPLTDAQRATLFACVPLEILALAVRGDVLYLTETNEDPIVAALHRHYRAQTDRGGKRVTSMLLTKTAEASSAMRAGAVKSPVEIITDLQEALAAAQSAAEAIIARLMEQA